MIIYLNKNPIDNFDILFVANKDKLYLHSFENIFDSNSIPLDQRKFFKKSFKYNLNELYKKTKKFDKIWFKAELIDKDEEKELFLDIRSRDRKKKNTKIILKNSHKELSKKSLEHIKLDFTYNEIQKLFSKRFFIGEILSDSILEGKILYE